MAPPVASRHAARSRLVFVIDDDPTALYIARRVLEARGLSVVTAGSVPEAMLVLHNDVFGLPSVLITDIRLPGTSGAVLARHLRSAPRYKDVAVVVTSGVETLPDLPSDVRFFRKPIDWTAFVDHVLELARRVGKAAAS